MISIRNLSVYFNNIGLYQMVISVDGVETTPSQLITIDRQVNLADTTTLNFLIGVLVLLSFCLVIFLNAPSKKLVDMVAKQFLLHRTKYDEKIKQMQASSRLRRILFITLIYAISLAGISLIITS